MQPRIVPIWKFGGLPALLKSQYDLFIVRKAGIIPNPGLDLPRGRISIAILFEFSWFCAKIELFPRNLSITKPKWLQIEILKALSVTNFENCAPKVPPDFNLEPFWLSYGQIRRLGVNLRMSTTSMTSHVSDKSAGVGSNNPKTRLADAGKTPR